jgi:hypothetical protein
MELSINDLAGVQFVENPYAPDILLRRDVFERQFVVMGHGEMIFSKSNYCSQAFQERALVVLGYCGLITEGMAIAHDCLFSDAFGLRALEQACAVDFRIHQVNIVDLQRRTVLSGVVREASIEWLSPCVTRTERMYARLTAQDLLNRAQVHTHDGLHEAAGQLRTEAEEWQGRMIAEHWIPHALQALSR